MRTVQDVLEEAWVKEFKRPEGSVITAGQIDRAAGPLGQDIIHAINILQRHSDEFRVQQKIS